jgi:hypothetical protein
MAVVGLAGVAALIVLTFRVGVVFAIVAVLI